MSKKKKVVSENIKLFENQILRVSDVAKILQCSIDNVYRLKCQKKIPFKKVGKTLYFMSHEIFDWVNQEGA